jgi:hypothetical protein
MGLALKQAFFFVWPQISFCLHIAVLKAREKEQFLLIIPAEVL